MHAGGAGGAAGSMQRSNIILDLRVSKRAQCIQNELHTVMCGAAET